MGLTSGAILRMLKHLIAVVNGFPPGWRRRAPYLPYP